MCWFSTLEQHAQNWQIEATMAEKTRPDDLLTGSIVVLASATWNTGGLLKYDVGDATRPTRRRGLAVHDVRQRAGQPDAGSHRGARLAEDPRGWAVLLDSTQGQQRCVLGVCDSGQACDGQALVTALRPKRA